ncbi:NADP-dependent oxidoreductase [Leucobacter japonicus]|uniref:NADP-dependent oxidoreductase n=1 Tax=Leucobacter japonicus TaxID=1461259 RepID=UPI0006A7EDC8|nr:NADP-dependent oxidoreductase [Leucobacter japonicus]
MSTTVQYRANGGVEQLQLVDIAAPEAGPGQVRVQVRYAGLNPVDWKIVSGAFGPVDGASGNGTDYAGIVDQVGDGVEGFKPGDLVFGGLSQQAQTASLLVTDPAATLHLVPRGLGLDTAGALHITGRTAIAGIRAIRPAEGETVVVSGASGGVGVLAAQLALNLGARVLGISSERNAAALRSLGIEPIAYGDGLADRLRAAAPDGIQAAFATQGPDELDLFASLGVPADRTNSIGAGPGAAESHGVHTDGSGVAKHGDLDWLAKAIAYGHIQAPVERVFDVAEVHEAYRFLIEEHPVGKVVLQFPATPLTAEQRAALLDPAE